MCYLKPYLLLSFFLFQSFLSFSQVFDWAIQEKDIPSHLTFTIQDKHVVTDKLGNVFIATGWTHTITGYEKIQVSKYSSMGKKLWLTTFEDASFIYGMNVDAVGNVFFISAKHAATSQGDSATLPVQTENCMTKLSPRGRLVWVKPVGSVASLPSMDARGRNLLKIDKDNQFYFAASAKSKNFLFLDRTIASPNNRDTALVIVKFDTSGRVLWHNHIATGGHIWPKGLDINDKGRLVIGGQFYGGAQSGTEVLTDNDYTAMFNGLFDMKTGASLWLRKFRGSSQYGSKLVDVVLTKNNTVKSLISFSGNSTTGRLYFGDTTVAANYSFVENRIFVATTDELGQEKTLRRIFPDNYTMPYALENDTDDNLFVCGFTNAYGSPAKIISLVKTDSSCNLKWRKRLDPPTGFHENFNNHFLQLFSSGQNLLMTGNVTTTGSGLYLGKDSLPNEHNKVTFTAKLLDNTGAVSGKVFADLNANHVFDAWDVYLPFVPISATGSSYVDYDMTDTSGQYMVFADAGLNVVAPLFAPLYFTVRPVNYLETITPGQQLLNRDFAFTPNGAINDLGIDVSMLTRARPGFPVQYVITFTNSGTTTQNGHYSLKHDTRLQFQSTTGTVITRTADSIHFSFGLLKPFETRQANITFTLASAAAPGSLLSAKAYIYPVTTDATLLNNVDSTSILITAAIDPNDKTVDYTVMNLDSVQQDKQWLEYTVRFQNTGTDTAYTVVIMDSLSAKLDLNTFAFVSSSHSTDIAILEGGRLAFTFQNILLPDSNRNEPASHGFVHYRIKPQNGISLSDTVYNRADIYFDYNEPVLTNTVGSYFEKMVVLPLAIKSFSAKATEQKVLLQWKVATEFSGYFVIERSTDRLLWETVMHVPASASREGIYFANDHQPYAGKSFYRLKVQAEGGKLIYSAIQPVNLGHELSAFIYPNPVKDVLAIKSKLTEAKVSIYNVHGKLVYASNKKILLAGGVSVASLADGVYFLQLETTTSIIRLRFNKVSR